MNLLQVAPEFLASRVRVVAVGGGHGLAATLEAVRSCGQYPIGIVSVADDGGSSGRLRDAFGHIPPGDLRRCISALLPSYSRWADLLEFRFGGGELNGHALGNLIFTALTGLDHDPVRASIDLCKLVLAEGLVLPACADPLTLVGEFKDIELLGQALLARTSGISKISLIPEDPFVPDIVLEALDSATTITLGPGSLYTSVIAACGIPAIRKAIAASNAEVIFVANLAAQVGEAENMTLAAHVRALFDLEIEVDTVLFDDTSIELGDIDDLDVGINWVRAELSLGDKRVHDPLLLAGALSLLFGRAL